MQTVSEIIDAFGGATAFAKCIGKNPSTASEMKRSGSIPVRYWPRLVRAGRERGLEINNDVLVAAHVPASDLVEAASEYR